MTRSAGRASNGGTEAINGPIELHRRIARGFRHRDNYRLRMLLIGGGLDQVIPPEVRIARKVRLVAAGRYRFRLRFNVSEGRRINVDEAEVVLEQVSSVVWLRALGGGQSLQDADTWLLLGSAYATESEAIAAGVHWRGVLERTFAVLSIAADFGDYAPKGGGFTQALLEEAREKTGHLVANEVHGLMVLPDDVDALVFSASAKGRAGTSKGTFLHAFSEAAGCPDIDDRSRLAYDIYSAAGFVSESPAARMVLLMMALETMVDVGERDDTSRAHRPASRGHGESRPGCSGRRQHHERTQGAEARIHPVRRAPTGSHYQ